MPRYLFSFEGIPPEDEGVELPDDYAALQVAWRAAREFANNNENAVARIVVFDAAGDPIGSFGPSNISN
jgi:hypothetical protein